MTTEWYENRHNVADLIKWMFDTGRFEVNSTGIDHAILMVRHAPDFAHEWRDMLEAQKEAGRIRTQSRSMPDDGSQEQVKDELAELGWC